MNSASEKFDVIRLGQQDVVLFQQLVQLFRDVFEMEKAELPPAAYMQKRLEDPAFIVFIVTYENEVLGGLTAYELANYYAEGAEVFIYDIAMKPAFQRMGLGTRLLEALKGYCREKGIKEFFVDALKDETQAVDFYTSTGGIPEKVIQFSYPAQKK